MARRWPGSARMRSTVVAMGGAANARRFLDLLGPHGIGGRAAGLRDAGAEGCFRRAVERAGLGFGVSRADMEALGFYVCTADLEDELIRALGHAAVEQIIRAQGELRSFRTSRSSPHSKGKAREQLHRFMGTRSGRKRQYARLLAVACASYGPHPIGMGHAGQFPQWLNPRQRPGEMVVAVCAVRAVFHRLIGISSFRP